MFSLMLGSSRDYLRRVGLSILCSYLMNVCAGGESICKGVLKVNV